MEKINRNIYLLVLYILCFTSCNDCNEIKEYYKNGNLRKEVCLDNNKYEGKLKFYYDNGNLEAISNWSDGVQNGLSIHYYRNGNVKDSAYVVNDIPHGYFIQYYEDGKIKKKGKYLDGSFYGKKFDYYDNGNIAIINYVSNNIPISYLKYDQEGENPQEWLVKVTKEDFFLDINDDTLSLGEEFKAKFTLNHKIADSVRIYLTGSNASNIINPIFNWPEEGSTTYEYLTTREKPGSFDFKGYVLLYYKDELDNNAGKTVNIPFSINYLVID